MYKLQLIAKYLIKRRIAWVALVAVMLCTAMVLIVVSVMGGWLKNFESSFHGMTGDVVIAANSPLGGFPYYQEMIDGVRKLPDVEGAAPIIHSGAMLNVDRQVRLVELYGYTQQVGQVNEWPTGLHLDIAQRKAELQTKLDHPEPRLLAYFKEQHLPPEKQKQILDQRTQWMQKQIDDLPFGLHPEVYDSYLYTTYFDPFASAADKTKAATSLNRRGMIVSGALAGIKSYKPEQAEGIRQGLYQAPAALTVVPVRGDGPIDPSLISADPCWIVDDNKSRLWQLDFNNVYISFANAQESLGMGPSDNEPARCSEVEIKARPGVDLDKLKLQVDQIAQQVRDNHPDIPRYYGFTVKTWIDQQGTFIHAVQNEVVLTTSLFGVISLVAVLVIFCIFYMIVVEKTKDIGIIKSVGATGSGILTMFLGYGMVIGLSGAVLGFTFAFFFVKYINEIHAWMGRVTGHPIWTPETYQFDTIPSQMEAATVVYVLLVAVLAATMGAMIPAIRAAGMNPVDALKYE